jgi:hypothetical protein
MSVAPSRVDELKIDKSKFMDALTFGKKKKKKKEPYKPKSKLQMAQQPMPSTPPPSLMDALTPTQIAEMFPDYYKEPLPNYEGMLSSNSARAMPWARGSGAGSGPGAGNFGRNRKTAKIKQDPEWLAKAKKESGLYDPNSKDARAAGTGSLEGTEKTMKQVYDAFTAAGFSDAQAKALTAEVGRENDFNEAFMFGEHTDANNSKTNIGIFSYQGSRRDALYKHLQEEGRIDEDGKIIRDQETLNSMARFAKKEMETTESGPMVDEFLSNPDITQERAAELLGKGYIRWDYDGNKINAQPHHDKRNNYYEQMGTILEDFELAKPKDDSDYSYTEQDPDDPKSDGRVVTVKPEPFDSSRLDPKIQEYYESLPESQKEQFERMVTRISPDRINQFYRENPPPVNERREGEFQGEVNSDRFSVQGGNPEGLDPKVWNVVNKAADDLPPGYTVKMISGKDARATGTTNHPGGLAMDVMIYDENGRPLKHDGNSENWKYYEQLYRSAVIHGKDMYPDDEFIWGGAWIGDAAGRGDPMHIQRKDPSVPGSSQSSGDYSFEEGLDPSHPFVAEGGQMTPEEREAWDAHVEANIKRGKALAAEEEKKKEEEKKGKQTAEADVETDKTGKLVDPKAVEPTPDTSPTPPVTTPDTSPTPPVTTPEGALPDFDGKAENKDKIRIKPSDVQKDKGPLPSENIEEISPAPKVRSASLILPKDDWSNSHKELAKAQQDKLEKGIETASLDPTIGLPEMEEPDTPNANKRIKGKTEIPNAPEASPELKDQAVIPIPDDFDRTNRHQIDPITGKKINPLRPGGDVVQTIPNAPTATPELKEKAVIPIPNAPVVSQERIEEIQKDNPLNQRGGTTIGTPSDLARESIIPEGPTVTPELKKAAIEPIPNAPIATPEITDKAVIPIPDDNTLTQETPETESIPQKSSISPVQPPNNPASTEKAAAVEGVPKISPSDLNILQPREQEEQPPIEDLIDQQASSSSEPNRNPRQNPIINTYQTFSTDEQRNDITQANHEFSPSAARAFARATNYSDSNSGKHFDYGATNTAT